MYMYDFLIVGSGLYGATCARELTDAGKKVLVVEKRDHIAGNAYTEQIEGIQVHRYGAHIFHTNDKKVWEYVNRFAEFNRFTNSPVANYKGELYSLPFNMHTFNRIWGVTKPDEAAAVIEEQRKEISRDPQNLEEQAIALVGRDIYEKLIKGYTEKQWGRSCRQLPSSIICRLPVRFTFDANYFDAEYQGVPKNGYTDMVDNMLKGVDVELRTDFLENRDSLEAAANKIIFTGPIDEYFAFCFGPLEYRSVRFETEILSKPNFQGVAVMNYTDREIPWTRIIEHKHFAFGKQPRTVISREYPEEWQIGKEPYYPINDRRNNALYNKYAGLAKTEKKTLFGGRLAEYRYYDMDKVIKNAFHFSLLTLRHTTDAP